MYSFYFNYLSFRLFILSYSPIVYLFCFSDSFYYFILFYSSTTLFNRLTDKLFLWSAATKKKKKKKKNRPCTLLKVFIYFFIQEILF